MTGHLNLPDTASVAHPGPDGRLYAPSAQRNADAIAALLDAHLPATGRMLELASGTGEHAVAFAARFPGIDWQPTDVAPDRLTSIDAHARAAGLPNLRAPLRLDATAPGWGALTDPVDAILLVNLFHLIPTTAAQTLLTEAAAALAPGGLFILYGPFLRDGVTTSDGDAAFNASLTAQDPRIGYKDDWDVIDWIHARWLTLVDVVEMPANNLAFVARKP